MAILYRITDWDEHFENSRTRTMKIMRWVPLPNKHDGDGYTALIEGPNGVECYACWVTITQVASRCRPRGTLVRVNCQPHDARSLSRMTRIPADLFDIALPRLVEIGWLETEVVERQEDTAPYQEPDRHLSRPCQEGATEGRKEGKEGTEEKRTDVIGSCQEPDRQSSVPKVNLLDRLIGAWNTLPAPVRRVTKPRSRDLLKAWAAVRRCPDRRSYFDDPEAIVAKVREQAWLHGEPWFCLAWLMKREKSGTEYNVVKVMEGRFRRRPGDTQAAPVDISGMDLT